MRKQSKRTWQRSAWAQMIDISELKQVTFLTTRTAWVTSEDWVKGCDWWKTSTLLPVGVHVVKNVTYTRWITVYLSLWFSCPRFSRVYHARWRVRHLLPKWRLLPKCVLLTFHGVDYTYCQNGGQRALIKIADTILAEWDIWYIYHLWPGQCCCMLYMHGSMLPCLHYLRQEVM
jgi:hypothetical protein